jgi:hypothetical protein
MSLSTIDMAEALRKRDAGIDAATAHCEAVVADWSSEARFQLTLYAFAAATPFTAEEAREWAERQGFVIASKRAWGGIIQGAKRRGEIVKVGMRATKASNGSERATYVRRGVSA